MGVRILTGDALATLRTLPDESVHCIVTSPPYYRLRDYGVEGQIGLEPTPTEFIDRLVAVFREARRVLRSDGTAWVNMGDSYASNAGGYDVTGSRGATSMPSESLQLLREAFKPNPRLNPAFGCWLMGWMPMWTSPAVTSSAQSAMASYRSALQRHLSSLRSG